MTPAFRAYDTVTEWMGPARATAERAQSDATMHNRTLARRGGYGSAVVVTPGPESPSRCVMADGGESVWPPHGRSCGAVRWPAGGAS